MSLFSINQEKCKRDGICAKDCPAQVIVWKNKDDFPTPAKDAEEFCINCGHCVAVCPYGALTLSTMPVDTCPPVQKDTLPDPATIRHFLMSRRSIRQYKKAPVPHDLLIAIIDAARHAPTGSNKQQVHWMIFENPVDVNRFAALVIDFIGLTLPFINDDALAKRMKRIISSWDNGEDRIMRGAPNLILVHSQADLSFAEADCVIALTYLELYAYAHGLGTCWAGYFTTASNMHAPLIEALGLPAGHRCYGAVMIGYPKYKYKRIPQRNAALTIWR